MTKTILIKGRKVKCRALLNREQIKKTDVYSDGARVHHTEVGSAFHRCDDFPTYRPIKPRREPLPTIQQVRAIFKADELSPEMGKSFVRETAEDIIDMAFASLPGGRPKCAKDDQWNAANYANSESMIKAVADHAVKEYQKTLAVSTQEDFQGILNYMREERQQKDAEIERLKACLEQLESCVTCNGTGDSHCDADGWHDCPKCRGTGMKKAIVKIAHMEELIETNALLSEAKHLELCEARKDADRLAEALDAAYLLLPSGKTSKIVKEALVLHKSKGGK